MKKTYIKILAFIMVLTIMFGAASLISSSALTLFDYKNAYAFGCIGTGDKRYEKEFLKITELNSSFTPTSGEYFFQPLYEYYSEGEENITEESSPDYVLIYAGITEVGMAYTAGVFGDYVLQVGANYSPYDFGYCIYIPSASRVVSLEKAYKEQIPNLEKIFTEYGMGWLLGDMDMDRTLTIKDATYIQKGLAGLCGFSEIIDSYNEDEIIGIPSNTPSEDNMPKYLSDFDRDGERTIKDATAIQKYIAGLEY